MRSSLLFRLVHGWFPALVLLLCRPGPGEFPVKFPSFPVYFILVLYLGTATDCRVWSAGFVSK